MATIVKAPPAAPSSRKAGQGRDIAETLLRLKEGQAVEVKGQANYGGLILGLSIATGKSWRNYKASDGKFYITLNGAPTH